MRKTYSSECYGELYEKDLGVQEYEEAIRAKGVKCYRGKVTETGRVMTINLGAVWSTRADAVKASKAKRKRSASSIEKTNRRRDEEEFAAIANINFGEGDYAIHLTFRAGDHPDAVQAWRVYLQAIRRLERKRGLDEVYALHMIEEVGRDGEQLRTHIHAMIKSGIGRDELEQMWRKRYGHANATVLAPDENGLYAYAQYCMKAGPTTYRRRRWGCTRNCKRPEPKRTTRLPNGKRLTKKLIYEMVAGTVDAKEIFEQAYPGWRMLSFVPRGSEYVSGVWVDIRMSKIKTERRRKQ